MVEHGCLGGAGRARVVVNGDAVHELRELGRRQPLGALLDQPDPEVHVSEQPPFLARGERRAAVELAKDWRTDRYLRRLEAMMIVADKDVSLVLTGTGDVLEPEAGVMAIGSGGNYALSAARALLDTDKDAETIVRRSLDIAADICVYTNRNVTIESLGAG